MKADLMDTYEAVIGLEIHAQLQTESKLFSGDSAAFGAPPNTHISPITLAHPGTLPRTNKQAVELAVKMGLACGCTIEPINYFARKNYFYPDLPKGYQVSQHSAPICNGGKVTIRTKEGERQVQLHHIHLEEDAGKSIHDADESYTCVDYNRAGVALIEIVSEPDMFSAEEAYQYVTEVRKLVRWLNICDGNMEEGSLRCDANVSIRKKGEVKLGTKVEVKNLNSIRNVKRAIEFEIDRMISLVEGGGTVTQQTRGFDATSDTTFATREKEEANDYRYFPEPDLPPLNLSESYITSIRASMPRLPKEWHQQFISMGLSDYDSLQLVDDLSTASYFNQVAMICPHYKAIANWMNGPLRQVINEQHLGFDELPVAPAMLAELITLVEEGKISFSTASSRVLPLMLSAPTKHPADIAHDNNWIQVRDDGELEQWVNDALGKMPDKVMEYKKGKKGLIGLFVGEVKKLSKGKADPKMVTKILEEKLSK